MISVTGMLVNPMNEPTEGIIRVISLDNSGKTLSKLKSTYRVPANGQYSFNLVQGKYAIEIKQCNKYLTIASVNVPDIQETKTLQELIEQYPV